MTVILNDVTNPIMNRDRVNRHAIPEVNKYKVYELRMKNQKLDNENPVYKKN